MPFKIVRNDLTRMEVDVIVNTANEAPIYSSGTDTAVYKAAGEQELLAERKKIGYMKEGEVAITPAFKLPAEYIIHAVSPRYMDGKSGEEKKLRSCYRKSLRLAAEHHCKSIAFPLIATGGFGYPKEEGIRIAVDEINAFLLEEDMLVYLVVFDTRATQLGKKLYPDLEAYIDHHYVCEKREEEYGDAYYGSIPKNAPGYDAYHRMRDELETELLRLTYEERPVRVKKSQSKREPLESSSIKPVPEMSPNEYWDFHEKNENVLKERMKHLSDNFQQYLFYLIGQKKLKNADVYKGACMTKQTFSKIKNNLEYHPEKSTAMRLCIGAKLNLDESKDLLARAGYALSPCDKTDIIFSYFLEKGIYDMVEISVVLEEYGLPCFIN